MGPSGFCFENVNRNAMLEQRFASSNGSSNIIPLAKKTGTTICGIVYKDGVVLGADTRATSGTQVVDKNCKKIAYITDSIYCCGAGTAADTDYATNQIQSQLELLRMNTGCKPRVVTACTLFKRMLFRYQGQISAALVLGGCDVNGPHVFQIYPHGSTAKLPYTTMGSGSLAAMSVFESGWTEGMSEPEAVDLVKRAILSGVFNDLGSGSNVDLCVIRTDGTTTMERGAVKPNDVRPLRDAIRRSDRLTMRTGTTSVISSRFDPAVGGGATMADVIVTDMET